MILINRSLDCGSQLYRCCTALRGNIKIHILMEQSKHPQNRVLIIDDIQPPMGLCSIPSTLALLEILLQNRNG
jgi:hypothetical protein